MYVKERACDYIRRNGWAYALERKTFVRTEGAANALYEEVCSWFEHPFKLFRNYSVECMHRAMTARGMSPPAQNGRIQEDDHSSLDSSHPK